MRHTRNLHAHTVAIAALCLALGVLGPPAVLRSQEKSPPKSPGKVYEIDTEVSRVYVRVDPDGRGHAHGVVGRFASGTGGPGAREGIGKLVIDLSSFAADDPEARRYVGLEGTVSARERRSVTNTMLGPEVLDTGQYPTATFTVTAISPLDKQNPGEPGNYQVDGKLELHGVSRPIRFPAKAERIERKEAYRVRGEFSLVQTDYGITPYSALFGALKVKNTLRVYGDVTLAPKPAK